MTDRDECLNRFMAAVRAARQGNWQLGNDMLRDIKAKFGAEVAKRQRAELAAYVESGKPA